MSATGKWTTRFLLGFLVIFAGMQLYRLERTNPPEEAAKTIHALTPMTSEVAGLLDRSCNDCHSNRTRWPWYSNVAPVSWLVVNDVNHARTHLNFSAWGEYPPEDRGHMLAEMCKEVSAGEMPLGIYAVVHRDAPFSSDEVGVLCEWSKKAQAEVGPNTESPAASLH